jgi:hypothetical protein
MQLMQQRKDILYLFSLGVYCENIILDKTLILQGEEKTLTSINGGNQDHIVGRIGYFGIIPWVNVDWHPAQEPYEIEGG